MTKPIVIIGSNGFAKEVQCLIEDINGPDSMFIKKEYNILGFINNEKDKWGTTINGLPVLGDEEWIFSYNFEHKTTLNCAMGIGRPHIKKKIIDKLGYSANWPNLIHPNVIMSKWIDIGVGNVITAGSILTCNIELGNHIMINLASTVGHDTLIDDYVVISPGVNVSGNVHVREGAYLGTGSKILEKLNIGSWSTIGGSALVNKDVSDNATVVGVPAKQISKKENGWHL